VLKTQEVRDMLEAKMKEGVEVSKEQEPNMPCCPWV
jgi:hypothetical protein